MPDTVVSRYDRRLRPTEYNMTDGTGTQWIYHPDGSAGITITAPDKKPIKIVTSADGRTQTVQQDGMPPMSAHFDQGGRLTELIEEDKPVLTQEWRPDGQLYRVETPDHGITLSYDEQALLSSVVRHPPGAKDTLLEWQETKLDRLGRTIAVTDCNGLQVLLEYNKSDVLTAVIQKTPEGNYGYKIERDERNRVTAVNSSWGNAEYIYDTDGNLKEIVATHGDQSAFVGISSGRVRTFTGFDGSRTSFDYFEDDPTSKTPKSILCPGGLKLKYEYDADDRLTAANVGMERRVRLEYDQQGRPIAYIWEPIGQ
jgi:YD repeat-containing protein